MFSSIFGRRSGVQNSNSCSSSGSEGSESEEVEEQAGGKSVAATTTTKTTAPSTSFLAGDHASNSRSTTALPSKASVGPDPTSSKDTVSANSISTSKDSCRSSVEFEECDSSEEAAAASAQRGNLESSGKAAEKFFPDVDNYHLIQVSSEACFQSQHTEGQTSCASRSLFSSGGSSSSSSASSASGPVRSDAAKEEDRRGDGSGSGSGSPALLEKLRRSPVSQMLKKAFAGGSGSGTNGISCGGSTESFSSAAAAPSVGACGASSSPRTKKRRASTADKVQEFLSPVLPPKIRPPSSGKKSRKRSSDVKLATGPTSKEMDCNESETHDDGQERRSSGQGADDPYARPRRGACSGAPRTPADHDASAGSPRCKQKDAAGGGGRERHNRDRRRGSTSSTASNAVMVPQKRSSSWRERCFAGGKTTASEAYDTGDSWTQAVRMLHVGIAFAVSGDPGPFVQEWAIFLTMCCVIGVALAKTVQVLFRITTFYRYLRDPFFQACRFVAYLAIYMTTSWLVQTYFVALWRILYFLAETVGSFASESYAFALEAFPVSYVLVVLAWIVLIPGVLPATLLVLGILALIVAVWASWCFQLAVQQVLTMEAKFEKWKRKQLRKEQDADIGTSGG